MVVSRSCMVGFNCGYDVCAYAGWRHVNVASVELCRLAPGCV